MVEHADLLRDDFATDVQMRVDAGASAGVLVVLDAADVVLFTIVFDDPCGTVAGGVLNFANFPRADLSPAASGTADHAELRDSNGTFLERLTVGLTGSGADVTLDSLTIVAGYPILMQSAAYTAPV